MILKNLDERAEDHQGNSLKERLWRVIFLSDTGKAKAFDVVLLWLIGASVLVIMLESVEKYNSSELLHVLEWVFTIIFTIEYIARIWVVRNKRAYMTSFFGVIDLLSIIPTYLMLFDFDTQYLVVIRILRLLRVFRVFKMVRHVSEANILWNALRASWPKITVFMLCVIAISSILGTVMYVVEGIFGENPGFSSVPQSIYWAIVTVSTTGFGDVIPTSPTGKAITSLIVLLGYAIIAVPTGIMTAELNLKLAAVKMDTRECSECGISGHDPKASHCKGCGQKL